MSNNKNTFILPPEPDFTVQIRSEKTGIKHLNTLADALSSARKDESIWKISFALPTGERCRLIKVTPNWVARTFWGAQPQWVYEGFFD
jgi:hypothetical protein